MVIRKPADLDHNVRTSIKGYDVPKHSWEKLNLTGNTQLQEMIMRMRSEMKDVPWKLVCDVFGFNEEKVAKWKQEEDGTPDDPLYRATREALAEDPAIRKQILNHVKTDDWELTPVTTQVTEQVSGEENVEPEIPGLGQPVPPPTTPVGEIPEEPPVPLGEGPSAGEEKVEGPLPPIGE
jgi:hypothetical protein